MDSQTRKTKPKYEIIKEALLARIHAGDFSFDESFCTEKMLSDQYHVSRITAKRAIEDLEQLPGNNEFLENLIRMLMDRKK